MIITIFAKPNAKENIIEEISTTQYKISVTAPPVKGLANQKIIELLAEHFNIAKSQIILKSGFSSRIKKFEIYS
ncbi:MAG: hypothetical protein UR93_C0009G0011 [Berkelbacteria bacterium GW2011_GWA2_35_9]|uniref:Uncharacterized protein n=1 Tax=Berkelbacteria bacterium GW2011_GWA2_35_9 TaxID=1618333 RepID=A0A0G0D640_9BACT|nr:MAG: hypothetical protein UR93_C0009G0011 [Berkelbacteria bacterium GW2011_GWA2_35_9]